MSLDPSRVSEIASLKLGRSSHARHIIADNEMCVMEAVAYVAGEPWSDHPSCACPVITAFLVNWNDSLPDADRTRLLAPLVPRLVGTKSSPAIEDRRSYMALDWLIRVHTPAWLDLVPSLADHATNLRALPEIVDPTTAQAVFATVRAARAAARAAAGGAAWDAAGGAAGGAARAAVGDAAGGAAWDAAWAAAGGAAWAAAGAKLATVVAELQTSALDLVGRMIAVNDGCP